MTDYPKLKQYGIKAVLGPSDCCDIKVFEQEFGSWALVTEAQPIWEQMQQEIETLRSALDETTENWVLSMEHAEQLQQKYDELVAEMDAIDR